MHLHRTTSPRSLSRAPLNMILILLTVCFALSLPFAKASYFDIITCSNFFPCLHVSPNGVDTNPGTLASPVRTIQRALNLVVPRFPSLPTRIVLQDGTYPGGIFWHGSSIILTSIHGSDFSFIDCNNTPNQHGIWIGSGELPTTVISGVTIQNCNATMGAGMAIVGPNTRPTLRHVVLRQNQATMGAGLFVLFGSPILICTETHNNRARDGAGIYVIHNGTVIPYIQYQQFALALNYVIPPGPIPNGANSVLISTDHRASGNRVVGIGAAIFAQGATLVITRAIFQGNQAGGSGGIGLGARSHLTITDSSFIGNSAREKMAGGIAVRQGSFATVTRVTFIGNSAAIAGGAIVVGEPLSTLIANSCIFTNNKASNGSIIAFDPTPRLGSSITNCRANGNVASHHGGIFFNNVPTALAVNLASNTFENNSAPFGADYGSIAASIGFVDPTQSQIGDSTHTPTILPVGYSTIISRTIDPLGAIPLRILIVDAFGQRITAPGIVNHAFLDVIPVTPGAPPASLVVSNTRIQLPNGKADVTVRLVGQPSSTYAIRVSTPHERIPFARVNVIIRPCTNPGSPACNNCINLV